MALQAPRKRNGKVYIKPGPKSKVAPHKDSILEAVMNGVELLDISKKLGVTPAAISNELAALPEYQAARTLGLEVKLRLREIELESASDMVGVTKSDKLLKLAQWKLERLVSAIYGQKVAVDSNVTINVTVDRGVSLEDNSKLIEHV